MIEKSKRPSRASAAPGEAAGKSAKKNRKSQERWADILTAATELFSKNGFYASSMQDISDAVGIQKGSLYYYVDSKEDILFEILRDLHQGGEALVASTNFLTADPLGELRSLLVQVCIYAGKHADRLRIFTNDFDYLNAEQQNMILSERKMYQDAVIRLIRLAIERGQASESLDVGSATQVILRGVSSISQWYMPAGPLPIERIAVQTAGLMVNGLAHYDRK